MDRAVYATGSRGIVGGAMQGAEQPRRSAHEEVGTHDAFPVHPLNVTL